MSYGSGKKKDILAGVLGVIGLLGLGGINRQNTTADNLHSLLGSSILGIGAVAAAVSAKKKKGSGPKIKPHHVEIIKDIIEMKKPHHVSDLPFTALQIANIIKKLKEHKSRLKSGSGLFSKLKAKSRRLASIAAHKLVRFFSGKTKLKPSQLLNYLAAAVGIAGATSLAIPVVGPITAATAGKISLGLTSAATAAKTSGRGKPLPLGEIPKKFHPFILKNKEKVIMLAELIKKKKGEGLVLSGQGKIKDIVKKLALVGITATGTSMALYEYLRNNPVTLGKILMSMGRKSVMQVIGQGKIVSKKKGKKRSREEVCNNPQGMYRTSGGLTKKDFIAYKKRVKGEDGKYRMVTAYKSKKKVNMGKALYKKHGSKLGRKKK